MSALSSWIVGSSATVDAVLDLELPPVGRRLREWWKRLRRTPVVDVVGPRELGGLDVIVENVQCFAGSEERKSFRE